MPQRDDDPPAAHSRRTRGRLVHALVVLGSAALALVVAFVVFYAIGRLFGSSADDEVDAAVMAATTVLVGAPLSAWLGGTLRRRVRDHLAADDRLECSVRVLGGQQEGLVKRWRPGVAALGPGHMTFTHTVGGLRFLRRKPVTFRVLDIGTEPPRKLRGAEVLLVTPEARAVRLVTPTALVECAITPGDRIPWALGRIRAL